MPLNGDDRASTILRVHYFFGGGGPGNRSFTVRLQVSNDGVEFLNTGSAITVDEAGDTPLLDVRAVNAAFLRMPYTLSGQAAAPDAHVCFDHHVHLDHAQGAGRVHDGAAGRGHVEMSGAPVTRSPGRAGSRAEDPAGAGAGFAGHAGSVPTRPAAEVFRPPAGTLLTSGEAPGVRSVPIRTRPAEVSAWRRTTALHGGGILIAVAADGDLDPAPEPADRVWSLLDRLDTCLALAAREIGLGRGSEASVEAVLRFFAAAYDQACEVDEALGIRRRDEPRGDPLREIVTLRERFRPVDAAMSCGWSGRAFALEVRRMTSAGRGGVLPGGGGPAAPRGGDRAEDASNIRDRMEFLQWLLGKVLAALGLPAGAVAVGAAKELAGVAAEACVKAFNNPSTTTLKDAAKSVKALAKALTSATVKEGAEAAAGSVAKEAAKKLAGFGGLVFLGTLTYDIVREILDILDDYKEGEDFTDNPLYKAVVGAR